MSLNAKQRRFALEYVTDCNATQAAIRAGYSPRTAGQIGHKLLKKVEILSAIEKHAAKVSQRAEVTQEWILERLKREAEEAETDGARVAALSWLGKAHAMFTDRRINQQDEPIEIVHRHE